MSDGKIEKNCRYQDTTQSLYFYILAIATVAPAVKIGEIKTRR